MPLIHLKKIPDILTINNEVQRPNDIRMVIRFYLKQNRIIPKKFEYEILDFNSTSHNIFFYSSSIGIFETLYVYPKMLKLAMTNHDKFTFFEYSDFLSKVL